MEYDPLSNWHLLMLCRILPYSAPVCWIGLIVGLHAQTLPSRKSTRSRQAVNMAELSVHSSGDEAASGSQAAEDSSDAVKEASHGQDSERQSSGEGSEGAQPEDDAPARCVLYHTLVSKAA